MEKIKSKVNAFQNILRNGMKIATLYKDSPETTIALFVKSGSYFEKEKNNGITHFIEHMVFRGSKNKTGEDVVKKLSEKNIRFDAYTSRELCAFYFIAPSKFVTSALKTIFNLIKNPKFDEIIINKEKNIILEEKNIVENDKLEVLLEKSHYSMYNNSKLKLPIIGNEKNIQNFNSKTLINFHRSVFRPENMALCIIGKINHQNIKNLAEYSFNTKLYHKKIDRVLKLNSSSNDSLKIWQSFLFSLEDKKSHLLSFKCHGYKNIDFIIMTLLSEILNNYLIEFKAKYNEKNIFAFYVPYYNSGLFNIYYEGQKEVLNDFIDFFKKKTKYGVDDNELSKFKLDLLKTIDIQFNDPIKWCEIMGYSLLYGNKILELEKVKNRVLNVDVNMINRLLNFVLSRGELNKKSSECKKENVV